MDRDIKGELSGILEKLEPESLEFLLMIAKRLTKQEGTHEREAQS